VSLQQRRDFFAQNAIEFGSIHELVALHPIFNTANDFQGRFHTYVAADEHFFQIIENLIIDMALTYNDFGKL